MLHDTPFLPSELIPSAAFQLILSKNVLGRAGRNKKEALSDKA